MRAFEIYDPTKRKRDPVAMLYCDGGWGDGDGGGFRIVIGDGVPADELPRMLALFAEQGQRDVPDVWARRWVEERIPPRGRQNLGVTLSIAIEQAQR